MNVEDLYNNNVFKVTKLQMLSCEQFEVIFQRYHFVKKKLVYIHILTKQGGQSNSIV